jgi:HSP20 family protein
MRYRRLSYGYALVVSHAALPTQTAWRPTTDVYETPTSVSVTVELAGVEPEELDVLFFDNAVVVEGQRRLPALDSGGIFHAAEIRRGQFRLEIALPSPVNAEPVEMRSDMGMLFIRLTKSGTAAEG